MFMYVGTKQKYFVHSFDHFRPLVKALRPHQKNIKKRRERKAGERV